MPRTSVYLHLSSPGCEPRSFVPCQLTQCWALSAGVMRGCRRRVPLLLVLVRGLPLCSCRAWLECRTPSGAQLPVSFRAPEPASRWRAQWRHCKQLLRELRRSPSQPPGAPCHPHAELLHCQPASPAMPRRLRNKFDGTSLPHRLLPGELSGHPTVTCRGEQGSCLLLPACNSLPTHLGPTNTDHLQSRRTQTISLPSAELTPCPPTRSQSQP